MLIMVTLLPRNPEVMETLMLRKPWEETGMVVLQAESELASINMVYGAAACGKRQ